MTFGLLGLIVAYGAGVVSACAGFIWLNRNKPDQLDKGEGVVRDWKKPF